jgi:hypothetical protein
MTNEKLDELERLLREAGLQNGKLYAEVQTVKFDDRYLYDIGHGEAAQGGDLHELVFIRPEWAELFVAATNALPELVARLRELEARVQELENAGSEMVDWAEHARIFVGSREKMHPDGQSFYDQARSNLYAVITRAALQTKGPTT